MSLGPGQIFRIRLRSMLLIAASCAVAACADQVAAADPAHPIVVELFQSQGCSSCPPANANLNAIAGRADVLALSFAVTYWDRLGWRDTFARPAFTQRQWDYARAGRRDHVATPQMIVNGSSVLNGGNRQQLDAVLRRSSRTGPEPAVTKAGRSVAIGRGRVARPATIWLVRYDPRVHEVPIRAGENGGRTLPHRNIVRALDRLGTWNGTPVSFAIGPSADPAWRSAVLVQDGAGGHILAASRI